VNQTTTAPGTAIADSVISREEATFWLERTRSSKGLVIEGATSDLLDTFTGSADSGRFRADLTADNALALRKALPHLAPAKLGLGTSVGFGDRLGICTPGHVRSLKAAGAGIKPVFAQQSIREMGRTNRTPRNVLDDATWGAFEAGWEGPVGADADHLHTIEDIDSCAAAGYVMFTLDPNDHVDPEAEHAGAATLEAKAQGLDWSALDSSYENFLASYSGHRIELEHESITLDDESLVRAMAKYGAAIVQTMTMYRHLDSLDIDYEFEMAVDETDYPTKPAEHVVIISELKRLGATPVSFAPRFVGGFEKGIEYIGSLDALRRDFQLHAEIARALGLYKLSLHSGSDKYSTYPLLAEATGGIVHLKTAGTSWAEALRVIARRDATLFRELLAEAVRSFEQNRKSYTLSCDPARIPSGVPDDQLDRLLTTVDSRQVLHVGYGALLRRFHDDLYRVWDAHESELAEIIARHFIRHVAPFSVA